MATSVFNQGSYTVSGIAPPRSGVAEQFQAGLQANLGRQDARSVMAARGEATRLAQNADKRAQTELEMRQEAMRQQQARAAQASARAGQQRQATSELIAGLRAPTTPATRTTPDVAPVTPPRTVTVPTPGTVSGGGGVGSVTGDLGTDVLGTYSGGYGAGQVDPGLMRAAGLSFAAPPVQAAGTLPPQYQSSFAYPDGSIGIIPDSMSVRPGNFAAQAAAPQGQPTRAEYSGIPFDIYPDGRIVNASSGTELPATGEYDALRSMLTEQAGVGSAPQTGDTGFRARQVDPQASQFTQDVQGLLRENDIAGAISSLQVGLATGEFGPMGSPLGRAVGYLTDSPEESARRSAVRNATQWFNAPENERLLRDNPDLIAQAATDPVGFVLRQSLSAETGIEPANAAAAAAEQPTTAEEAAPAVETPYGGLQLDFGTPVQLTFGETQGNGSKAYVAAPERIFADAEVVARQRQRLDLLANYYQQTNNLQGLTGVLGQLDELDVEQRYLDGMQAIVGIQQENFGPAQQILQQRYPGQQVEVRPYTDGTVEIFLDGQSEARLTWDDMATNLQSTYDRGFIEQQQLTAQTARDRAAELWTLQTTEMLRGAREIAVANNQADIDRYENNGQITRVGETASGQVVFQSVINGTPMQFVYVESVTKDPATGDETVELIATPVDQTLVR